MSEENITPPTIPEMLHALANDVQRLLILAGIRKHDETHPVADATQPVPEVPEVPVENPPNN